MKKSNLVTQLLPHICIILSVVLFTITIADMCNVSMKFLDNDMSRYMLLILCLSTFISSIILCAYQRHEP